jgi:hypothetical protein
MWMWLGLCVGVSPALAGYRSTLAKSNFITLSVLHAQLCYLVVAGVKALCFMILYSMYRM